MSKYSVIFASALGEIGPAASHEVQALIALLKDPANDVRRQAIWALGKIKDKAAVPPLIALLKKNPSPDVIEALGEIGREAVEVVPLLKGMIWGEDDNLPIYAIAAWKRISPESMNDIVYEEQAYANVQDAVSKVVLLPPTKEEHPTQIVLTFKWILIKPKSGVRFCFRVLTDKGTNPFDDSFEKKDKFYAGHDTQLTALLNYSRYYDYPFEVGVKVKACRDADATCNKGGSCVGRTVRSNVVKYRVHD